MTTPNMNLTLPVVSQTLGPQWASEINADLSLIDSHNHTSGQGALVPVAGLDINADLSLATHSLTNAVSVSLLNQASLATLNSMYAKAGELWWNDGSGNNVKLTNNGAVNVGSVGSITGMILSCAVNYLTGPLSYQFLDENGNAAALDCSVVKISSLSLFPGVSSATYTLRLPANLPVAPSFVTATVSGSVASMAFNTQAGFITRTMQAAVNEQIGTSSSPSITSTFSTFTSATSSITVTSVGRPIVVGLMSDESPSPTYAHIRLSSSSIGMMEAFFHV